LFLLSLAAQGKFKIRQGRGKDKAGGDLHLIKTKIQNFKKIIFIIDHIKKYIIFLK